MRADISIELHLNHADLLEMILDSIILDKQEIQDTKKDSAHSWPNFDTL